MPNRKIERTRIATAPPPDLAQVLTDAAHAHHEYEVASGQPDDQWAIWYAQYITDHYTVTLTRKDA